MPEAIDDANELVLYETATLLTFIGSIILLHIHYVDVN